MNIQFKVILSLSLFFVIPCEANVNNSPTIAQKINILDTRNISQPSTKKTIDTHKMIAFAKKYKGTPYAWGGITSKGFDCSGFIQYIYKNFNISIPRTTASYTQLFDNSVPLKNANVGDLIVFTGTNLKIRKPGHAGIITEIKPGLLKFIHSSSSKKHFGVTETSYYQSGYPKRFLTVIRMPNPSKKEY
ncbi:C40 family peptidase [Photobacterium toruni]|uniref:C40 family peptidase n=1 Tax=Photobacterium toruni TaxID=1935446 RepID=UPI002E17F328|nr:C40 family peptidase [Photobacterium toruni]